uniref:Taste receptor type 2 n=1 Tax=Pyxicephalus adspersus TaxID=30357 RepID=A0AAV3A3G4_PYXAD|nr:TPA: hypothetical protein GDO54_009894 [Pyxicephalus adspersus]
MANCTEDYKINLKKSFFDVATPIIILAGLMIQSFIVAVNVMQWMKGRSITSADKIITSIGISRMFFHTAFLLIDVPICQLPKFSQICSTVILFITHSSSSSSMYLSVLLSFFFYFKISTFHNVFLCLKAIILRRVVYLIIASVLLSLVYSSMFICINSFTLVTNPTQHNISDYGQENILSYYNILWNTPPLFLVFIASALLIILLGFHIRKMNKHGNVRNNTDTYQRTMRFTVASWLSWSLYILVYLAKACFHLLEDKTEFIFIINIFPSLLSICLIYAATKLRNQFFRFFHCGTLFLPKRKTSKPKSKELVD